MAQQGVIAESIISFAITWQKPGNGEQPKWDQNKQSIEIHETDVYPDLQYTSAYGAPQYVKYTSGSLLNELLVAINKIIDKKVESLKANEEALPPGPDAPKQLGSGQEEEDDDSQKALPAGPDAPKQLAAGQAGGALVKYEQPLPPAVIDNKPKEPSETEVTPEETGKESDIAYTVIVRGDKLRFLEGQQERGAYSAGVKFLYKVSNNITKTVAGDRIDNKSKIWAEIKLGGLLGKTIIMKFEEFNETEFKFGGNLLAQVLPSIELSFTPDPNSVYSKEKPELDLADVIKATNITLKNKTTTEIKSIQKQIQKELEVREPSQKEKELDKQSSQTANK